MRFFRVQNFEDLLPYGSGSLFSPFEFNREEQESIQYYMDEYGASMEEAMFEVQYHNFMKPFSFDEIVVSIYKNEICMRKMYVISELVKKSTTVSLSDLCENFLLFYVFCHIFFLCNLVIYLLIL